MNITDDQVGQQDGFSPFLCEISGCVAALLLIVCGLVTGVIPLVWFGMFAAVAGVLMGRMVDEETSIIRNI